MKLAWMSKQSLQACLAGVLLVTASVAVANDKTQSKAPAPAAKAPAAAPKAPAAAPKTNTPANGARPGTTGANNGARPGTNGAAGARPGTTGAAGTRGATGTTGAKGATNTTGAKGATNTAGAKGGTGAAGGKGATNAASAKAAAAPHSLGAAGRSPAVSKTVTTKSGNTVGVDKRGNVRTIQGHGMTVNRGPSGNRRVVTERNGHTFVSNGHGGYAQSRYRTVGGREYYSRTYVYGGRSYARVYGGYPYRGGYYYRYYPTYYYQPAYYGWAYNPWPAPVAYGWGWGGAPWYGYYGAYFEPYPVYPYASLWLADYLIAANLQAAYDAGVAAGAAGGSAELEDTLAQAIYGGGAEFFGDAEVAAKLSPELKSQIAEQIKAEINAEKVASAASTGGTGTSTATAGGGDERPTALDPSLKLFVVSTDLDVSTDDGADCSLSTGDVVERIDADAGADNGVHVKVRAGKKSDCKVDSLPQVDLNDLQEMHNHFREQIDSGLETLAKNSGKNGLPAAPTTATIGSPPPAPDPTAASQLAQQQKDADAAEAEAKQEAASAPPQN
jgi:hypothetical protein